MKRLVTVLVLSGAALSLQAEDRRPPSRPTGTENQAVSSAGAVPLLSALPQLRAGAHKVYREIDGKTQHVGYLIATASGTETVPLPTSPAEIETLRQELKTLRDQQIDSLDVETLLLEVSRERKEARAREAWKGLQQIRKDLLKLEQDHPGTPAADLARQIQSSIPEHPASTPTPTPATPLAPPTPIDPLIPVGPGKPVPDLQPSPPFPTRQPSPFGEPN